MSEGEFLFTRTKTCCNLVLLSVKRGSYTKEQGVARLREIEAEMYAKHPEAEQDGDITFAVAEAHEELTKL